jgi:L-lactate dehydrogenase complex protein LldF
VLVHLRGRVVREERGKLDPEGAAMRLTGRAFSTRRRYEAAQRLARLGRGPLARFPVGPLRAWAKTRDLPPVPAQSFRDWWRERGAADG